MGHVRRSQGFTRMTTRWYRYASPREAHRLAGRLIPWLAIPGAVLLATGLYLGLVVSPTDFQQGDAYRVLFVHVPAAWMGMLLYVLLAFYAGLGWAFRIR